MKGSDPLVEVTVDGWIIIKVLWRTHVHFWIPEKLENFFNMWAYQFLATVAYLIVIIIIIIFFWVGLSP
jgi:hypothetical protein